MVFIFIRPGGGGGVLSYIGHRHDGAVRGRHAVDPAHPRLERPQAAAARRTARLPALPLPDPPPGPYGRSRDQQAALAWRHPPPASCGRWCGTSRLWERRPSHPDFAEVRHRHRPAAAGHPARAALHQAGRGPGTALRTRAAPLHPRLRDRARDQPIADPPARLRPPAVRGDEDPAQARAMVRAMVAQLAAFHAPDDLRIALCVARPSAAGRLGVGQVAAARPAPARHRRRRARYA